MRRPLIAVAAAAMLMAACADNPFEGKLPYHGEARLAPLPASVPEPAGATGVLALGLGGARDGQLFVPAGYDPSIPAPLALLLHGAGGAGSDIVTIHQQVADSLGILLLAPDSRTVTWDAIFGRFSYDLDFIDQALADVVSRYNVDRQRLAIVGFSDGATYGLTLGLRNGDRFQHVILHSPGGWFQTHLTGRPAFFIAHGTQDPILPVRGTRRTIVPLLEFAGFDVTFVEFDGGHGMQLANVRASMIWLAGR